MNKSFLQAEWRKLAIANYVVDPSLLKKYLPAKTELDLWNGLCYVSLIGFMFQNTRLKGIRIPFHVNFEEVNLRFYVKYKPTSGEWRRGVVFIKEIVPKPALALVANVLYKEHYEAMPMKHAWTQEGGHLRITYQWKTSAWNTFSVLAHATPEEIAVGSEEEFITEHYWGYTRIDEQTSGEYQVEHPRWRVYPVKEHYLKIDFGDLYSHDFAHLAYVKTRSVFLAEGSEIVVKNGVRI